MTNGMRDLKKEKYWQEIIERQKVSGKNQSQFCKDEGLSQQFCYWKGVLAKRQKIKNQAKPLLRITALPFVTLKVPMTLILTASVIPLNR